MEVMEINEQSFFEKKRILITGITGFKGSWLAIWLKKLGAEVYGYALAPKSPRDNFERCHLDKELDYKIGDIRDKESVDLYIQSISPDIIFHLAAQPIVVESYKDPVYNYETNVLGTVNLLEAFRRSETAKVFLSITTDKVYKNVEQLWGYRENDALGGKDPYSASKSCAEIVTHSYQYSFLDGLGKKVATARAGNVIGGGDWAENRIVPDIYRALINKLPLKVRNPNATRPWQHVLEPLSGYLKLASAMYDSDSFLGAWNFGPSNSDAQTVKTLLLEFEKLNPELNFQFDSKGFENQKESLLLSLDSTKAKQMLSWESKLSFEETVEITHLGYEYDISKKTSLQTRLNELDRYLAK